MLLVSNLCNDPQHSVKVIVCLRMLLILHREVFSKPIVNRISRLLQVHNLASSLLEVGLDKPLVCGDTSYVKVHMHDHKLKSKHHKDKSSQCVKC